MADKTHVHPAEDSPAATAPPDPAKERPANKDVPDEGDRSEAVADLERQREDFRDRWLRKTAEFENYRKRIERERREQADQAVVELLRDLLAVVDDFDLAMNVDAGEAA